MAALAQRLRREDGQVMALLAAGMFICLLGVAGLVLDIGRVYVVKRQLQATADAAATAAAYDLPSVTTAAATAVAYGPAGKNPVAGATQSTTPYCLKSIPYCYGATPGTPVTQTATAQANGLVVSEQAQVQTTFLKLFGKSSFSVSAKAVACGVCGATKLDIALVLDRTASMDGYVGSLRSAVEGFLGALNPDLDQVALFVLPPGPACGSPSGSSAFPFDGHYSFTFSPFSFTWHPDYAYASQYASQYLVDPLTSSFQSGSTLYSHVDCLVAGGPTSYKGALQAAYTELNDHGRADAQKVIVFESDGAANDAEESAYNQSSSKSAGSQVFYAPSSTQDVTRPCQSAVDYANTLKPSVTIYTVAYGVNDPGGDHTCYASPFYDPSSGLVVGYRQADHAEPGTAASYLTSIASKPSDALDATKTDPASIVQSFQQIVQKLQGAALVPDSEAPSS